MDAPIIVHPREQMRLLREKLAEAAQRLIDAMDAIDGDADLEPNLAHHGTARGYIYPERLLKADSAMDELELDTSDLEDGGDREEEPDNEPDNYHECGDASFSMNQEGTNWAYGDGRSAHGFTNGLPNSPGA